MCLLEPTNFEPAISLQNTFYLLLGCCLASAAHSEWIPLLKRCLLVGAPREFFKGNLLVCSRLLDSIRGTHHLYFRRIA